MNNSTTNTYSLKRDILNFAGKISAGQTKPEQKFFADMIYGMLASSSCLLTDIADQLHEDSRKINTVDRLSRRLSDGVPWAAQHAYLSMIRKWCPKEPVIHIDDSDVIKPEGYRFEALGWVRDGSKSTKGKNVYEKGYHVTEATALTMNNHPVSIYSRVHSSAEKEYTSANTVTYEAIVQGVRLFKKATFVMDRGYDDNKMFLMLDELKQDYVIRMTQKRKLFYRNKWVFATELCNRRKGKVKMPLYYKGKWHDAYISHVKVKITASRKDINLVLVYGITEHPMMLATNREIFSKDDLLNVAKLYFSRWRIEEYFRSKKQLFQFENFRVRKLDAINALNFFLSVCMAFLAHISRKKATNALKCEIIRVADPIRDKVFFLYYRIAKGVAGILAYAQCGIRFFFRPQRRDWRQVSLKLPA